MEEITREQVLELASTRGRLRVSIYLPTQRVGSLADHKADSLRLKNLLKKTAELLRESGGGSTRKFVQKERLDPLEQLLGDSDFWAHQAGGLALLVGEDGLRALKLPLKFPQVTVVSDRFHTKPLLPLLDEERPFFVLALSLNEVRLFRADRFRIAPLAAAAVPPNITAALGEDDNERLRQHQTPEPGGRGAGAGTVFHGHGGAKDLEEIEVDRFVTAVARGVAEELSEQTAPLIFAGVEELFPLYRNKNKYPGLWTKDFLAGNHEHTLLDDLHRDALSLLRTERQAELESVRARLAQADGRNPALTAHIPEDIYTYAVAGKIDTLLTAVDSHAWARLDANDGFVERHDRQAAGDVDLLDVSAAKAFATGAKVYVLPQDELPDQVPAAALLRL